MFRILSEQLHVLLTTMATSVLLKRTQHSWDPSCTDLGHVQLFITVQTAPAEMPVSSANLDTFIRLSAKSNFPISGAFLQKSLPQDV